MNVVAEIGRINDRELALGVPFEASWHQKYASSAWVFVGGLPFELSEGDVLCVMSQFGEIEDVHLVRDATTGRSRGFAFLKFEDQRSTVLAVDNLNGARVLERVLRVDHVLQYKLPKEVRERHERAESNDESDDEDGGQNEKQRGARGLPGHAYEGRELENGFDLERGHDVFAAPEESKRERKKRRKEDKKREKRAKKARKLEAKQFALFAEIQQRRQLEREREDRERGVGGVDERAAAAAPEPSASGWRGRFEPNAAPARAKPRDGPSGGGGGGGGGARGAARGDVADASYGGARRTR
ncbi:hypothetical protein PybrP1_010929 [[Pythium] brassicae (nom. inval.)]|nr:hypothetical protein PybrP1_010929 [[Pythium] brassicae (nom. inval.)]